MARTLKLNEDWDISLDRSRRIEMAEDAYATAQNVANRVRLFQRDAYFDQTSGLPHFQMELGEKPPESLLKSRIRKAALEEPGIREAAIEFSGLEERELEGNISLTLDSGETADVIL